MFRRKQSGRFVPLSNEWPELVEQNTFRPCWPVRDLDLDCQVEVSVADRTIAAIAVEDPVACPREPDAIIV